MSSKFDIKAEALPVFAVVTLYCDCPIHRPNIHGATDFDRVLDFDRAGLQPGN
jgi:hypothetical protein